jgi:hypothetical protein
MKMARIRAKKMATKKGMLALPKIRGRGSTVLSWTRLSSPFFRQKF